VDPPVSQDEAAEPIRNGEARTATHPLASSVTSAPPTPTEGALMTEGIRTVIYPVRDLAKAKTLFSALVGAAPDHDAPYYVGFKVNGQDIGLDPNGHASGMTGPIAYWHVDDIKASLTTLIDGGAESVQEVKDVGGGRLIASVKDSDGNVIGLIQSPW
jgi:predicted enzyme related to lactoylglutathione lyase